MPGPRPCGRKPLPEKPQGRDSSLPGTPRSRKRPGRVKTLPYKPARKQVLYSRCSLAGKLRVGHARPLRDGAFVGGDVPDAPWVLFLNDFFLLPHAVPKAAQFSSQRQIIPVAVDDQLRLVQAQLAALVQQPLVHIHGDALGQK